MKKLFKWLFRLLLVLFLFVLVLILCLNPIAKFLTERQIRNQTGLDVTIGKLSIGLGKPTLAIENFRHDAPPISVGRFSSLFPKCACNTTCRRFGRRESI